MALHTELPIYRTGVRLLDLAVKAQVQMPRTVKRVLGEKITQHCVEMLDLMALANATQRDVRAGHTQPPRPHPRCQAHASARACGQGRLDQDLSQKRLTTMPTYPPVIGLTGYAGTGKDTVRAMLEQRGFVGLAFADPIRNMIRDLFASNGISEEYMDERALKEQPIPALGLSYRHLAQTLGTEWGRRCLGEGFWLNIAEAYMADITTQTFGPLSFVISDVRFPNEAAWVKQRGGQIWRIERRQAPPVRDHDSERQIDSLPYDQRILNHWALDDLEEAVCAALGVSA